MKKKKKSPNKYLVSVARAFTQVRPMAPLNIFPLIFPPLPFSVSLSLTFRLCPWKLQRHYGYQGSVKLAWPVNSLAVGKLQHVPTAPAVASSPSHKEEVLPGLVSLARLQQKV